MGPLVPGVRVAIGVSGSGKSHGLVADAHAVARAGFPVLVVDTNGEEIWETVPRDLASVTCRAPTIAAATRALASGKRIALVTPEEESEEACSEALEEACRWAIADKRTFRGVVCHEAWLALPHGKKMRGAVAIVSRAYRHKRVGLWLDAQRFAVISTHATSVAQELRIYATSGDPDLKAVATIDADLLPLVREAAARVARANALRDANKAHVHLRGYHVTLDQSRLAPHGGWKLER